MKKIQQTITCRCGQVEFLLTGTPIMAVVCHCDDCQRASKDLEALPGAPRILDSAGGTPYVMHHRSRATCVKGAEHLVDHEIANEPHTKRVVAGCCQTPLYLDFAKGFWQSWFRDRWPEPAPQLKMRNQTQYAPEGAVYPDSLPRNKTYSLGFMARLLAASWGGSARRS